MKHNDFGNIIIASMISFILWNAYIEKFQLCIIYNDYRFYHADFLSWLYRFFIISCWYVLSAPLLVRAASLLRNGRLPLGRNPGVLGGDLLEEGGVLLPRPRHRRRLLDLGGVHVGEGAYGGHVPATEKGLNQSIKGSTTIERDLNQAIKGSTEIERGLLDLGDIHVGERSFGCHVSVMDKIIV